MRVRPRVIRGVEHRVELVLIHQVDEQLPERFAAGHELLRRFIQRRAGRRRRQRALETPLTHGRHLAGRDQILNGQHLVAGLRAA